MLIMMPYAVDVPFERHPIVNWLLLASIIGVFCLQFNLSVNAGPDEDVASVMEEYHLDGFNVKGLFGHMWVHGGFLHLIGNMIFLWIFVNAVCQKIGNLLYMPIYLFVGLFAAVSYLIFCDVPGIGASGAINGIVGMYLVFFPVHDISCWWMFWMFYFRSGTFSISGYWMILLWLAFDIWGVMRGGGGVGYVAHLGGFAAGAGLGMLLLITKIAKMDKYDESLLDIIKRGRRKEPPPSRGLNDFEIRERIQRKYAALDDQGRCEPLSDRGITGEDLLGPVESAAVSSRAADGIIRFYCGCGQKIKMPVKYAGRAGTCPKCGGKITIPAVNGKM